MKPKRPCSYPGCPELTADRYCDKHQKQVTKEYDQRRGSAAERGYNHEWRKARNRFLAEHPLCVMCEREGKLTPANVVDHIVPHKGDKVKFWDQLNWQGLCVHHHSLKTAKEDGRWG